MNARRSGRCRAVLGPTAAVALLVSTGTAVALVGGTADLAGAASGATCGSGAQTLTVQGRGTVSSPPNLLTLTLDVSTSASTAEASLTANNTAAAAVIAALTSGGVATKDLQTTGLSIQPQYTNTVITGYSVDNSVVAKVRQLPGAGGLIDAAVVAGGNAVRIDGLQYSVTDPTTLQDKARSQAVHQAVTHATAMAKSAGEHLGPICSLTDETQTASTTTVRRFPGSTEFSPAADAPAATTPVQQGSEQETDQVKVVYALVPGPRRR